jgi:hypothetical protein
VLQSTANGRHSGAASAEVGCMVCRAARLKVKIANFKTSFTGFIFGAPYSNLPTHFRSITDGANVAGGKFSSFRIPFQEAPSFIPEQ